jgi:hypothetical protein
MQLWKATGASALLLLLLAAPSFAARLTTTFTAPSKEASVSGDTCAAGTSDEISQLVARRCWVGPVAGCDSLVNIPPGSAVTMNAAVPTGVYTTTVVTVDQAGNVSCPVSITKMVRGKPAAVQNLTFHNESELRMYLYSQLAYLRTCKA